MGLILLDTIIPNESFHVIFSTLKASVQFKPQTLILILVLVTINKRQ